MAVEFADLAEVKTFFNIEDNEIDDLIDYLISYYSEVIIDDTGKTEKTIKTKKALFYAIGCHLTKTNLEKIYPTLAYTVGDVKERFQSPNPAEQSWCTLYQLAIGDILADSEGDITVRGARRPGLSDLSEFQ